MEPSATNPTGEFEPRPFDNVYLDMNGILHNSAFGIVEIVRNSDAVFTVMLYLKWSFEGVQTHRADQTSFSRPFLPPL